MAVTDMRFRRPIFFVSVPFTRGTPLWQAVLGAVQRMHIMFQSPSRGGRLCGENLGHHGVRDRRFQSPSRGGRLCGDVPGPDAGADRRFQSPSRGGRLCGITTSPSRRLIFSVFQSPSRGGRLCGSGRVRRAPAKQSLFQSPSRGGRLCGIDEDFDGLVTMIVSVPFTRGTPLWRRRRSRW